MGYRVLIVEEESIIAEDLTRTLEDWGNTVVGVVNNGRRAVAVAKEFRPDFLIIDVKIRGDRNGIETALEIGSCFTEEIPVVFLSTYSSSNYPMLDAIPIHIFLDKPFSPEELLEAISLLDFWFHDVRSDLVTEN